MFNTWTKHIQDPVVKGKFEQSILGSRVVLERLKDILNQEEQALDRSEMDIKVFDLPNWENRQAFKNGYRSCLSVLKKLIDLDQQQIPTKEKK